MRRAARAGSDRAGRPDHRAAPGQGQGQGAPTLTAKFLPVQTGIRDGEHIEITAGLQDGARVITTGAGALKDGDRIVAATPEGRGRGGEGGGERANREGPQREGSSR